FGSYGPHFRCRPARCIRDHGDASSESDAAPRSFPLTNIYRHEPLDVSALRCAWWNIVFPAAESDSSAALLRDWGGRGTIAVHIDHFASVALVWWTSHQDRKSTRLNSSHQI